MFADPKLASEESKMVLSGNLAKEIPAMYQIVGLRFQFQAQGKRYEDAVAFLPVMRRATPSPDGFLSDLEQSGYLPRPANYVDYQCAVDFASSTNRDNTWFDAQSDVVACNRAQPIADRSNVWLTALELRSGQSDTVFEMEAKSQDGVYWKIDDGKAVYTKADEFGRAVVPLGNLATGTHELDYGPKRDGLDGSVCFHPLVL